MSPDGTKQSPQPMLTFHQRGPLTFPVGQFNGKYSNSDYQKNCLKKSYSKYQPHLPGAKELIMKALISVFWQKYTSISCVIIGLNNGFLLTDSYPLFKPISWFIITKPHTTIFNCIITNNFFFSFGSFIIFLALNHQLNQWWLVINYKIRINI